MYPVLFFLHTRSMDCIVCRKAGPALFAQADGYRYFKCAGCGAVFMDPAQRLGREEEHDRYLTHENDVHDPAYRAFLGKVATPLLAELKAPSDILDYGCGPGPALAAMLEEAGHSVHVYDPFFYPDKAPLARSYDAITCTEVAEHLYDPATTFAQLAAMLKPLGWLAVMTGFLPEDAAFEKWHYRRDPTHVVFYRAATFGSIAAFEGWRLVHAAPNVILMQKPL